MLKPTWWVVAAGLMMAGAVHAQDEHLERARRVLNAMPLIDGHNDLPWVIRQDGLAPFDVEAYDLRRTTSGHTDIARLRAGQVGAQFWSVYIPMEAVEEGATRYQLEQIDIARRLIRKYPDVFGQAYSVSDVERIFGEGRIASVLGIEGGHAIENSLGALRAYYDLGARYITLTHAGNNDWADSGTDSSEHGGLTEFGKEVIREMNRLGMLVDLSHTSPQTMNDVLDVAEAPVIYSHSSARALTDHRRNVPDQVLRRLPENGGVVMVTFVPVFVSEATRTHTGPGDAPGATLSDVGTTSSTSAMWLVSITSASDPILTGSRTRRWALRTCRPFRRCSLSCPVAAGARTIFNASREVIC